MQIKPTGEQAKARERRQLERRGAELLTALEERWPESITGQLSIIRAVLIVCLRLLLRTDR